MTLLVGALTMGLILSLLALGVYISFRIFAFPDITADGSFTLGAAVAAVLAVDGTNPWLAAGIVFLAGMAAGATTGILHTKFDIHKLLAGILVMTALYSVNLRVMGKSNIPLMGNPPQLSTASLKNPAALAGRLRKAKEPLSAYLLTQLKPDTQKALEEHLQSAKPIPFPESLTQSLVHDLNAVLQSGPLFDDARFRGVRLSRATKRLLGLDSIGDQQTKLNRMLLDDAYPDALARYKEIRTLSKQAGVLGDRLADGRPRIDVLGWDIEVFDASQLIGSLVVVTLIGIILYMFFQTNLGTAMRATGDNPDMIRALGVNVENMIIFGLAISNGLIALSGAMLAQYNGFADVQMGIGMVVWGLASVIIGEALVGRGSLGLTIVGAVMGSILFRLLVAIALRWGLNPNDLKGVTAVFVFIALILPAYGKRIQRDFMVLVPSWAVPLLGKDDPTKQTRE